MAASDSPLSPRCPLFWWALSPLPSATLAETPVGAIPLGVTAHEKYDPAMQIATEAEAEAYFARLVEHQVRCAGIDRSEAKRIERSNLGYWAGYYPNETRARVEKLFRCAHPFFGAIAERGAPTYAQAVQIGMALADRMVAMEGA